MPFLGPAKALGSISMPGAIEHNLQDSAADLSDAVTPPTGVADVIVQIPSARMQLSEFWCIIR